MAWKHKKRPVSISGSFPGEHVNLSNHTTQIGDNAYEILGQPSNGFVYKEKLNVQQIRKITYDVVMCNVTIVITFSVNH